VVSVNASSTTATDQRQPRDARRGADDRNRRLVHRSSTSLRSRLSEPVMVRTLPARSGSPICEYLGLLPSTLQRDGAYTPHVVSPGRNVGIETSGPIVAEIVKRTLPLSLPPGILGSAGRYSERRMLV
jgi:hypothetical protein